MEYVAAIVGLIVVGIILDMLRGRKPQFRIYHGQKLTSWDEAQPTRSINSFANTDGPGDYRIIGVDRATKMDTTWHCSAQSALNARTKAELEGIVVTKIERVNSTPLPANAVAQIAFRITGVDRKSNAQTIMDCLAETEVKARIEAEKTGLIVKKIELIK